MKSDIRSICILSGLYPTPERPAGTFVDQLVCTWADMGIKCTVITPTSYSRKLPGKEISKPREWSKKTKSGNEIIIYSPRTVTFSDKNIFGFKTLKLTARLISRAYMKEFQRIKISPDVIYGHFIVSAGLSAAVIGNKNKISSFIGFGESSLAQPKRIGLGKVRNLLKGISGVISVSTENKKRLIENDLIPEEKIEVFPNSIDNSVFYPRNKQEMRNKFNFGQDDFIVAFVGHFINRKGTLRLSKALDEFNDVKSIFIGSGPEVPTCKNILFSGKTSHDKIPEYLSAADIFVLPTLNEGCCNAIIEAMACGLPIISSDLPFNDDILFDDNSIKIDPNNVSEIKNAIEKLYLDPELREKMSRASLLHSADLNIKNRAKKILDFMERKRKVL